MYKKTPISKTEMGEMSYTMLIFPDNDFALSRTLRSRQVDGVRGDWARQLCSLVR